MTGEQLAKKFEQFLAEGWGYVYGAQGELYTEALAKKWRDAGRPAPNSSWNQKTYFTESCKQWFGKYVADCSGGIVYAIQQYISNYKDRTANTFKSEFSQSGSISTLPEIRGLALWRSGHIGVYVGNGYVIEFKGTNYGCVKTKVSDGTWTHWGKIRDLDYTTTATGGTNNMATVLKKTSPLTRGDNVLYLQKALNLMGYSAGTEDGICGDKTIAAIEAFSKAHSSSNLPSSVTVTIKADNKTYTGTAK